MPDLIALDRAIRTHIVSVLNQTISQIEADGLTDLPVAGEIRATISLLEAQTRGATSEPIPSGHP